MFKLLFYKLKYRIEEIQYMLEVNKMKKLIPNYNTLKFVGFNELIWAGESYDNLIKCEPNIYTMNDIEVWYNHKTKMWSLGIEKIYSFEDGISGQIQYLQRLLKDFTRWMVLQGHSVTKYPTIYDKLQINMSAESVEQLYLNFRMYVTAFSEINNEIYI